MDIAELRSEFSIFVVEGDSNLRSTLTDVLAGAKYQVESFSDGRSALEKIKENPPHIIIADEELGFFDQIQKLSSDIRFIFMLSREHRSRGVEGIRHGAFSNIEKPFVNISEAVFVADRAAENTYLQLQNEQLIEDVAKSQPKSPPLQERPGALSFIQRNEGVEDPDQVMKVLVEELSLLSNNQPTIFLKYLPAYQSLAVTASAQIPLDSIRMVGIRLDKYDPKIVSSLISDPASFAELKEMMNEIFKCTSYFAAPLKVGAHPTGILIVFAALDATTTEHLKSIVSVGSIVYGNRLLFNQIQEMSVRDSLTGLHNRRFFNERLEEEMTRARRTHYPLSVIYLDIDHFKKYNDAQGPLMGDIILKSVAQVILRTSRKTDVVVRLGGEEFAILCPATAAVGAAVKAEKIRLTIESTKFPKAESQPGGKITISAGVSEYPSIANDGILLVRSADDALYKVKQGGRNRVCLAEPPSGFKADFEPLPVPGFQPLSPPRI